MAAQLTLRNMRSLRMDILWVYMARISLPVPLSPIISTGISDFATSEAWACSSRIRLLDQTKEWLSSSRISCGSAEVSRSTQARCSSMAISRFPSTKGFRTTPLEPIRVPISSFFTSVEVERMMIGTSGIEARTCDRIGRDCSMLSQASKTRWGSGPFAHWWSREASSENRLRLYWLLSTSRRYSRTARFESRTNSRGFGGCASLGTPNGNAFDIKELQHLTTTVWV